MQNIERDVTGILLKFPVSMVLVSLLSTLKICHTHLFIMFLLLTLSRLMLADLVYM